MLIKNITEFLDYVEEKGIQLLYTIDEVKSAYNKIIEAGNECTIVSIQDENDGEGAYLEARLRRVNNIGYYVLEGNIEFENEYIEY